MTVRVRLFRLLAGHPGAAGRGDAPEWPVVADAGRTGRSTLAAWPDGSLAAAIPDRAGAVGPVFAGPAGHEYWMPLATAWLGEFARGGAPIRPSRDDELRVVALEVVPGGVPGTGGVVATNVIGLRFRVDRDGYVVDGPLAVIAPVDWSAGVVDARARFAARAMRHRWTWLPSPALAHHLAGRLGDGGEAVP